MLATVPISMVAMSLLGLDDGPGSGEAAVLFIIAGFLVLYAALSLGTFLAVPHAELKRWVAAQPPSTFLRRYVWLIQPGGGIALYFAFAADYLFLSVGMTAAYSPPGVTVRSSVLRRRMTLQMLIGFVFATVILASIVGLAMSELR